VLTVEAPVTYVDRSGETWSVWDILDGRRVAPGVHQVGQRLLVRERDGWGFIAGMNPHCPNWPTAPHILGWNVRCALEGDPVRTKRESDAAHAARVAEHKAWYRAAQRVELEHGWAVSGGRPCPPDCPICARTDERDNRGR
jgi:hypothetical protein